MVLNHRATEAKETLILLSKLRDPRNLVLAVGLAQLLEPYCDASISSQHSTHFPTQNWESINAALYKLESLAARWEWSPESLKHCDIEAPKNVIEKIREHNIYEPVMSEKNAETKKQELIDLGILQPGQTAHALYEDGQLLQPLSGSILMEVPLRWRARRGNKGLHQGEGLEDGKSRAYRGLTTEDLEEIVMELEDLAGNLIAECKRRLVQPQLQKAMTCAFASPYDWANDLQTVLKFGQDSVVGVAHRDKQQKLLQDILKELPPAIAERFDVNLMLEAFSSFLKMSTQMSTSEDETPTSIYETWYKKNASGEEALDSHTMFSRLFQNCQIRTCSEAMA